MYAGNIILIHFYVTQEHNLWASMRLLFRQIVLQQANVKFIISLGSLVQLHVLFFYFNNCESKFASTRMSVLHRGPQGTHCPAWDFKERKSSLSFAVGNPSSPSIMF